MTSFRDLNRKLFGNCAVEWRINKFSLQTFKKKWLIQSPEFSVNGYEHRGKTPLLCGYEETKWRMNLQSKLVNDRNFVLFSLRRSAIDSGPKYIQLNVKICFRISKEKYICSNDKVLSLKNGSLYEVCLGSIESMFSKMHRSDDLLAIVCHMIVYSNRPSTSTEFGECSHAGLKLLSKNMLDLYTSAQNFDTKFIIHDNVILTHKAILWARNEYLSSMIGEEEGDDEFKILKWTVGESIDYKAARKVLAYLYTGDIRHVLEEPSFAIYHCASFLEISEIETHYKPDWLTLESTIDFEEYLYTLRGYECIKSLFSWHCETKESMKTYELRFYPKSDSSEGYIPLFTKTFATSMLARLEFHFVYQIVHSCSTYFINDGDMFVNMDKIVNGVARKLVFNDDTPEVNELRINLKLTAGIKTSFVGYHTSVSVSLINEDFYYERLSSDLEFLLDGGPFADTVIDNNGTFFWVHKCILASRSRLFSDILITNEEGEAIVVSNIDPHIVSVILTYIYSGLLSDVMDDDVIEVYKAAVIANFLQLKSMCSDWLKLSSKTNGNIRCRALRIAEKYKDSSLMKSVLDSLFERQNVFLSLSLHSFRDVNACSHCLSEF